jgi:PASTA domain
VPSTADAEGMAARFAAIVPRMAVIGLVWLLATGTMTYAAGEKLTTPAKAPTPVATPRPTLLVPDIRGQAFVFAKGILEDGGFGWRVTAGARGYATNVVVSQEPAAGTVVEDTGAPTVKLTMRRGTYPEHGTPQDSSPYAGTSIVLPKSASAPVAKKTAIRKRVVARPKTAAKPKATRVSPTAPKHKVAVRHRAKVAAKPKIAANSTAARSRPPAFVVPGARKEPLNEIPLTQRAKKLETWIGQGRKPTNANVRFWLYQHAWIVAGAELGWWHGASALRTLIRVDKRVEARWGVGSRSESIARAALAQVEAKSR